MKRALIVVDMQNDFIDGALGTKEARAIVPHVVEKIKNFDGEIIFMKDTHDEAYLNTAEGQKLPVEHCIRGTHGWELHPYIEKLSGEHVIFEKNTFGCIDLSKYLLTKKFEYLEFVGLCTDICVISNAMIAKAALPEADIIVDSNCCAGVTPESHNIALKAMGACQIDIS